MLLLGTILSRGWIHIHADGSEDEFSLRYLNNCLTDFH